MSADPPKSSSSLLSSLSAAVSAANKALTSARKLHSHESYPRELMDVLSISRDDEGNASKLPLVDILSVKSSMLTRYIRNIARTIEGGGSDNDDSDADNDDAEADAGAAAAAGANLNELEEMKFAMLKMRSIERKMDYTIKKTAEKGTSYADQWRSTGKVDLGMGFGKVAGYSGAGRMVQDEDIEGEGDGEGSDSDSNSHASSADSDSDSDLDAIASMVAKKVGSGAGLSKKGSSSSKSKAPGSSTSNAELYTVPKTRAVDYEGDKKSKREMREAKGLEKMRKLELLQSLQSEFNDVPEMSGVDGVSGSEGGGLAINREAGKKIREAEEERKAFEEERFVRLVTGRKEKKEKKRLEREGMSVGAMAADFGVEGFSDEEAGPNKAGFTVAGREVKRKRHVNGKRAKEDEFASERKKGRRRGKETTLGRELLGDGGTKKKKKKKKNK